MNPVSSEPAHSVSHVVVVRFVCQDIGEPEAAPGFLPPLPSPSTSFMGRLCDSGLGPSSPPALLIVSCGGGA